MLCKKQFTRFGITVTSNLGWEGRQAHDTVLVQASSEKLRGGDHSWNVKGLI